MPGCTQNLAKKILDVVCFSTAKQPALAFSDPRLCLSKGFKPISKFKHANSLNEVSGSIHVLEIRYVLKSFAELGFRTNTILG